MSENHREPEVPEEEVPAVECLDGLARITLEELAITHFVKNGNLQNACSTRPRVVVDLGKSAHSHIVRLMNSRQKGLKRMMTKVQWLFLKRGDWQERGPVTDQCHDRPGKPGKRSDKKLGQKSSQRRSSDARQLGCVRISRHDAAEVYSPEVHRHAEANPTCETSQRLVRVTLKFETKILRSDIFAQVNHISAAPTLQILRIGLSRRQSGKSKVPAKQRGSWPKDVLKLKEHERATFFSPSEKRCLPASTLKPEEREFVVDSGASMHMISKKDLSDAEMDTLTKSCSPTIVITANGEVQTPEEAIVYVQELNFFLTMQVLDNTPAVLSLGKLCDENGYSYEWINGQKPHLIKNGIRIICKTENFVPIVVPGLSSSSSGSSSTLRTPMKQESHSSSSSSHSSPTVSEIQVREREDATNRDISPVPVSNLVDDGSGQPDEIQANKNPKPNKKGNHDRTGKPVRF